MNVFSSSLNEVVKFWNKQRSHSWQECFTVFIPCNGLHFHWKFSTCTT